MFILAIIILGLVELTISFYQIIAFNKLAAELDLHTFPQVYLGAILAIVFTALLLIVATYLQKKSNLQVGYKLGIIIILLALIAFSSFYLPYTFQNAILNS